MIQENGLYIITVLCLLLIISEWLVRKTWLRHAGTALLVIILGAVASNLGIIPSTSTEAHPVPVYNITFSYLAPLSILWLLLKVNLKDVLKAGLPIISLFLVGSLATAIGVWSSITIYGGETLGAFTAPIGGMIAGTYTGGSINFNAVALHYDMMKEGALFGGTIVVDNIITTLWMIATIVIPTALAKFWPKKKAIVMENTEDYLGIEEDTESIHPLDMAICIGIGTGSLWISSALADWTAGLGFEIPSIIILTVIALILAQFSFINRLQGSRMLGLFAVYIFLCVIGAYCDIGALAQMGSIGIELLAIMATTVLIHGIIIFGFCYLTKMDLDQAAVASQANIGGGTTALALARSIHRNDLVLPAVLLGSLGNALGTFIGFTVAGIL